MYEPIFHAAVVLPFIWAHDTFVLRCSFRNDMPVAPPEDCDPMAMTTTNDDDDEVIPPSRAYVFSLVAAR